MGYLISIFKWVSIILRIIPVFQKLYPHIVTAIEVIKEEITNGDVDGDIKKVNVQTRLQEKLPTVPSKLSKAIDNTVASLNELGGL